MTTGLRWSKEHLDAYNNGKRAASEVAKSIPERDHLNAVLEYLQLHSSVAWATRINSGMWREEDRVIRFGFTGCADILGQMKDGRFMAFECKRVGGKPSDQQFQFLRQVSLNGGVAGWGQLDDAIAMVSSCAAP